MTKKYNERRGKGLTWRYLLLDTEDGQAPSLASRMVAESVDFFFQHHPENPTWAMFRVLEGDFVRVAAMAVEASIRVKEVR